MLFLLIMETPLTTNPRLDYFRAQIGNPAGYSPSPFGRWLGGVLQTVESGRIVLAYTVREDMTNPVGTLHGGVASGIMDDVAGMLVYTLGAENAYTSVNLTVDFLHSARINDVLTATAEVIRAGKNIVHVDVRIRADDGKIIAKCATNLIQTSFKLPF